MNRIKKAFSLDYKDQGSSSTDQSNKKRFSLFKTNSKQSRPDLPRLSISTSTYIPALGSAIEMGNRHSQQILDYRPKSAHYDAASVTSFNTTTTATTNTTATHNHYASMQSINSDLLDRTDQSNETDKDAYLQLGMKYHEKGELEKATHYWRLSAESGSPLGLFFYGIALRHGWGCKRNPAKAVCYLQSAAESAVHDLQTGIAQSASVAKSELVLAIYELGVCFRHGWGVPKNLETATYYFQVASNLGDPDAQNDLGFCYSHGLGVKKDLYSAAKYYRLAERQGQGMIGNSWIWKEKYNQVEAPNWKGKTKEKK